MTMAHTSAILDLPRHLLGDGGLLARFHAAPVKAAEVDRVEQQRREAALAGEIGDEAPCEREQKRRAFDKQERLDRFLWQVPQHEGARVHQLDIVEHAFVALGLSLKGKS